MEFEKMENYLEAISKVDVFVKPEDTLTLDDTTKLAELLKKYGINDLRKCFEPPTGVREKDTYTYELKCETCKNIVTLKTGKSLLFANLRLKNMLSYECKQCQKERNERMLRKYDLKEQKNCEWYRNYLFDNLLNPNCSWKKGVKTYVKIDEIKNCLSYATADEIREYIKDIGYYEYLKTPYWRAIAEHKKYKNKKCQLCGATENLNVHHTNYDILGIEVNNLNDLTVLCEDCHHKFHKLEEE